MTGPEHLARALRLMVITDPVLARGRTHEEIAALALRGGATALQLRDKDADDAELLRLAMSILPLCRRHGAVLVINDRPDVARLASADGCHLGPEDISLQDARLQLPAPVLLGFSAGTAAEAREAELAGADYIGVGPVFATGSKPDAGVPLGIEGLTGVVAGSSLPAIAIGGINPGNAAACIAAGASGLAVLAAVVAAPSVAPAARLLRRAVDGALAGRPA